MKMKPLALVLCLFMFACSTPSPKESAILNYAQNVLGTHVDMKGEILGLEMVREMYALDSALLLYDQYKRKHRGTEKGVEVLEAVEDYNERKTDPIAEYYLCVYAINNPVLNGQRQEITKYFIFQGDNLTADMDTLLYSRLTEEIEKGLK